MSDERLISEISSHLTSAFGIASTWTRQATVDSETDYVATLTRGASHETYAVTVKPQLTLASIAGVHRSWSSLPVLVVGQRITARSADAFHDAGIQYLDAAGNGHLSFGDVYIDVRGRQLKEPADTRTSAITGGTNLFSPRRAQVICVLLAWPHLVNARVKDVADSAGVSMGQAHDTINQLRRTGYLGHGALRHSGDLLDLWAASYSAGLGATLELARLVGDLASPHVLGIDTWTLPALSGEAAVQHLLGRRLALTVYVDKFEPNLMLVNRWRRDPELEPNVFVRRRFWGESTVPAELDATGQELAPWPLVYADLLATGDPRHAEVAKVWRDRHVA